MTFEWRYTTETQFEMKKKLKLWKFFVLFCFIKDAEVVYYNTVFLNQCCVEHIITHFFERFENGPFGNGKLFFWQIGVKATILYDIIQSTIKNCFRLFIFKPPFPYKFNGNCKTMILCLIKTLKMTSDLSSWSDRDVFAYSKRAWTYAKIWRLWWWCAKSSVMLNYHAERSQSNLCMNIKPYFEFELNLLTRDLLNECEKELKLNKQI